MKDLIKNLNEGVIYHDTHHIDWVDADTTSALMREAASKIEKLEREKEEILQETKAALVRMQAKIDDLKSGEPYGWVYEDKYISPKFILNFGNKEAGKSPSDTFLNENKEFLTPLFKYSKPSPPLLTDDEISNSIPKGYHADYDAYESGFFDGVRWAEEKVRSQYEK